MKISHFLTLLCSLLVLSACTNKTRVESDLGIEDAPAWVNEGNQALNDQDGRLFHGVGQAPKMQNASLQKSTADARARAEVANIFSSYIKSLSRDYATSSGLGDNEMSQQSIARRIENITRLNLSGAVIIAHWKDRQDGTIYALAEVNMKNIKSVVASAEQMDETFKNYFRENGDSLFDRMAQEQ